MFSPIAAADNIKDEFIGYISTLFHISDKDYAAQFAAALREEGAIAKGPYLDVSDSYKTGESLAQLIEEGEASALFRGLEGDIPDGEKEIQINRGLYLHQERALYINVSVFNYGRPCTMRVKIVNQFYKMRKIKKIKSMAYLLKIKKI